MTPLHHAYLLKGWLLDKNPPKEVIEALEAITGALGSTQVVSVASEHRLITGTTTITELLTSKPVPTPLEVGGAASSLDEPEPVDESPAVIEKGRRKHNMSPEARAAAAERMRAYQAKRKAERESAAPSEEAPSFQIRKAAPLPPAPAQSPKKKPAPQVDIDRLITLHKGYAGKREDGTLTDGDWPDIKARLAKSPNRRAVASDYDIDIEDLNTFIAVWQGREARSSGEASASPSGVASDAARRRW